MGSILLSGDLFSLGKTLHSTGSNGVKHGSATVGFEDSCPVLETTLQ